MEVTETCHLRANLTMGTRKRNTARAAQVRRSIRLSVLCCLPTSFDKSPVDLKKRVSISICKLNMLVLQFSSDAGALEIRT